MTRALTLVCGRGKELEERNKLDPVGAVRRAERPSFVLRLSVQPFSLLPTMSSSAVFSPTEASSLPLAETTPPPSHSIVSRTVLATPELRVVLFSFAAGQALTEHTSTARAVIQVLTGAGEFTLAGVARQLRAGDLLHMPPKLPHAIVATEPMTMLLVLAPERR